MSPNVSFRQSFKFEELVVRKPSWLSYALAFVLSLIAIVLRRSLDAFGEGVLPFALFFPVVLISSLFGGMGPGILSLAIALAAATAFWLSPEGLFSLSTVGYLNLALFSLAASSVIAVATLLRAAILRSRLSDGRLQTLIEGIPQLVWRADPDGGWTWASPQWENLTGLTAEASSGDGWLEALHPDDRSAAIQAWSGAASTLNLNFDCRIRDAATSEYSWFQTRAVPVQMPDGTVLEWLGTCTDVNDLRELQGRQIVLVGELQHRTRNLMAVIRSMCEATARSSQDYSEFRAKFVIRLDAMARAQGLLSRLQGEDRVTFDELLEAELTALHGDETPSKVILSGPRGVRLRSSAVQTIAMALHELTTNALKHGALSQERAKLEVSWVLEPGDDTGIVEAEPWLRIDWRERGVQMNPDYDARVGHGRELIECALPFQLGAQTKYELGPDGVSCTIWIHVAKQLVSRGLENG